MNGAAVTSYFSGANGLGNAIDPDATVFGLLFGLTDPLNLKFGKHVEKIEILRKT